MDYVAESLHFQLNINREFQSILFEQMEMESAYIMECLDQFTLLTEAVEKVGAKKDIFRRFIDFIKRIFGMFKEKSRALFQSNESWMKENFPKFEKINYDALEIEIVPFWLAKEAFLKNTTTNIHKKVSNLARNKTLSDKYKTLDDMKKNEFGEFIDEHGDFTEGLKNHLRVGNSKKAPKAETIRGNALREKVLREFIPYCQNYETATVPFIQNLVNVVEKDLRMLDQTISRKPVQESFCLIENAMYADTELRYVDNFVVTEAEQPAPNGQGVQQGQKKEENKPVNPSKVQVKDYGDKETQLKQDGMNTMSKDELIYYKNIATIEQNILTCAMTIYEERFTAYLTALKQILAARKDTIKEPEVTPQSKQEEKPQSKKEAKKQKKEDKKEKEPKREEKKSSKLKQFFTKK